MTSGRLIKQLTAAQVRTLLSLVVGINVQAWDPDLDALAALAPSNDDIVQRKAGAWTNRTPAQLKTDLAIAESDVTNLVSDLATIQTLAAIQGAQAASQIRADTGYYVGMGGAITASPTSGKVQIAASVDLFANVEVLVAANTALSTTITSLADATNPKWVVIECDSTGTIQFNAGTAAASPTIPDITASRVPHALLWIPANATAVDALLTINNGNAKIIDLRTLRRGVSPTGWQYDAANIFTSPNTTVAAGSNAVDTATFAGAGTLNVGSTTGFPSSGIINVVHGGTVSQIYYTGTTSTTFTGCLLVGTNVVMATNDVVRYNGFTLAGSVDQSAVFCKGTRVRWYESGVVKYMPVVYAAFGSSRTDIGFPTSSDYQVGAAPDAPGVSYSYVAAPQGFPGWFNYTPVLSGWSSAPTSTSYRFSVSGTTLTLEINQATASTSNATTTSLTSPILASSTSNGSWQASVTFQDNGANSATYGRATTAATATSVTLRTNAFTGAWTASGNKKVSFVLIYEI